ncbi:RagB/SusD family nutrient uptake outer membrane protein [Pontibacter locisalis]|uniref:RagB/SusD family nutrient uptake outer membrane protein n=1 Tax=Pontibacter locisalis TaxID=1719035 RepID=A0ABW5IK21_9BACT
MKNKFFANNRLRLAVTVPALALSLMFSSCDKEVTDLQPYDRLTEATAFETPERAELAMAGVYDAAQSGFYLGGAVRGYPFGAASIEQGDMRGEDMLNVATFYAITYGATYNASSANNQYMWETLYGLINKANVVIEGVQAAATRGVITAEKAKTFEAESRFLRALAHHELLVHFARPYKHTADASHAGVPYRTVAVNTPARIEEVKVHGRNTVKESYDKLIEDLTFAEANLPETRAGSLKISRATKGAAIALKTRVLLHKGDYAGVITEGNKIISTAAPFTSPIGSYKLESQPDVPFASYANNKESVFSIENSSTDNAGVNGGLPAMYGVSPARGLVAISPIIYNASFWKANDLRRTLLTTNNGRAFYLTKYRDAATNSDYAPLMRYSEVLLNVAEAIARTTTGADARAVDLLNAVRNRSVTTVADQFTAASFATSNDLIQAILNERRIEFLGEGRRWSDIHRLAKDPVFSTGGVPAKVAYTNTKFVTWAAASGTVDAATLKIAAVPYDDYRFVWPLPITEVNANPVLAAQQNPGY